MPCGVGTSSPVMASALGATGCVPSLGTVGVGGSTGFDPRVALAGDWTDVEYPATLEAAVRSGAAAALALLAGRQGAFQGGRSE